MRKLLVTCFALLWSTTVLASGGTSLCESSGRYRECRIGSSGVITLAMDLSAGRCVEGVSWGTPSAGSVWVDRGCRGMFHIEENTGTSSGGAHIVCESENGGHRVCPANTRLGVSLVRQLSSSRCIEDVTWGYDTGTNQIWVDDGCRGEFKLSRTNEVYRPEPKLDGVVTCGSINGRRVECKADTSEGVQLIRTLNDNACRFRHEWGYDGRAIWVKDGCHADFAVHAAKPTLQTVICASDSGARSTCEADTTFGVALIRDFGDADCLLNKTWGFEGTGVWVADGCRAEFALGGFRLAASAVPASAMRMVCESVEGKQNECVVEGARGVGLVRQISDAACVLNRTWGYGPGGIWVSAGCRAEFAVLR